MSTAHAQNGKTQHAPDDIAQQLETLRADLMRLAATMSDDVSGGIGRKGRQINHAGREARTTLTTAILNHPLMAFSQATGLGLVLGLLAMKR